ncbi:MAG: ABC transporter permease [Acidimicrobiales bacterium]|nr:ABC transporter permease [Acidimicrobiales bacterium]
MRPVLAQARIELVLTLRRGESLLLTLGIPVLLLAFFSLVDVLPTEGAAPDPVDFLAPGVLGLAVMSTAMVGLGIATGFERQYGVLKRLGATPLGRPALLAAKTGSVVALEGVQVVVLVPISLALGWSPGSRTVLAVAGIVLGTIAFAGIGLALAGSLRGEVNLAALNGLYLVLLLLGGMVIPLDELPAGLAALARLLPAAALSEVLHGTIGSADGVPATAWLVLAGWAVLAPAVAAITFRWD